MTLDRNALEQLHNTPSWDWPADTGPALLDLLRNRDADDAARILGAELAGNSVVIHDELVGVLLSVLRNNEESEDPQIAEAVREATSMSEVGWDEDDDFEDDEDDDGSRRRRRLS